METKAEIIGTDQAANTLTEPHIKIPLPAEVHQLDHETRQTILRIVEMIVSAALAIAFRRR